MSWSYSGDPSFSEVDAIRFLVGDTDESDPLVSDEEIEWFAEEWSDKYHAAAAVCETLAAKFAREVNVSADGMSFSGSEISRNFNHRAEALRQMSGRQRKHGLPYFGGASWKERAMADRDPDKIPTSFRSHMHDHPDAGQKSHHKTPNPLTSDQ